MHNSTAFVFSFGFILAIFISSCSNKQAIEANKGKEDSEVEMASMLAEPLKEADDKPTFKNVSEVTHRHVDNLIKHYDVVKNALVQSDFDKTQKGTQSLIKEVINFNNKRVLKDEQDAFYLKVGAKLKNNAERIQKSKDLKEQRQHLSSLTSNLYDIVKAFSGNESTIYYQYCPMAFENNGGYWLSLKKEIENPYFGDKMMKCGVVRETIK